MNAYRGPPMTLGNAAAASVRFVVWCLDCRHQAEPDPAEMAERYGAAMPVPDWRRRWSAAAAAAGASIWLLPGRGGDSCGASASTQPGVPIRQCLVAGVCWPHMPGCARPG